MQSLRIILGTLGVLALVQLPLAGWAQDDSTNDTTSEEDMSAGDDVTAGDDVPTDDDMTSDDGMTSEDDVTDEETEDEEHGGLMTAVDSTAKHLDHLENDVLPNAPESAQPALEHALLVSAHGNAVVTAVQDGLRGQDLAAVAASMKDLDHGPPGSLGVRSQGRPDHAGPPENTGPSDSSGMQP